jgi:hypothetical protein
LNGGGDNLGNKPAFGKSRDEMTIAAINELTLRVSTLRVESFPGVKEATLSRLGGGSDLVWACPPTCPVSPLALSTISPLSFGPAQDLLTS